jgi:hypothetical protein
MLFSELFLSLLQPALERSATLAGFFAKQHTFDAEVFIQIWPMNGVPRVTDFKVGTLVRSSMR